MNHFDIVLVLAHFRAATAYLSVIRAFASKAKIGLLVAEIDPTYLQKTAPGQNVFMRLCKELGAEIVEPEASVHADLLLIQQYHYSQAAAENIQRRVSARKRVGMMGLASAGLEKQDSFLALFGLNRVFVPSRRLMQFLIAERGASSRYADVEAIEVGLPFRKHPVFPEFQADYIIAAPTMFSFRNEAGKQHFLETAHHLLEQIPSDARIAYKTHNGNKRDYFAPKFHYALGHAARRLRPLRESILGFMEKGVDGWRHHAQKIETSIKHMAILDRAVPLQALTPYADISIEAFLPGVRHGVIGGLSNTIWGTLYSGLVYYNCVDPALLDSQSELLPHKNSDAYLDTNLRFFGVPYCRGELERGARGEQIVTDDDRKGDLIASIVNELNS